MPDKLQIRQASLSSSSRNKSATWMRHFGSRSRLWRKHWMLSGNCVEKTSTRQGFSSCSWPAAL